MSPALEDAWLRRVALAGATGVLLTAPLPAPTQTVYRCTVDGRTTYQPSPCPSGGGATVAVGSGPSEAEAAAARQRAERDKARAAAIPAPAPPPMAAGPMPGMPGMRKTDCASLVAARDQAMASRNRARGQARQGDGFQAGSAGDLEVGRRDQAALDAARAAQAKGC